MVVRRALFALVLFVATDVAADVVDIRRRGQLRVVVPEGVPEFFARTADRPGFEREVLEGFCRLMTRRGWRLDLAILYVPHAQAVVPALLSGRADVAAGGLATLAMDGVDFTEELLPSRYVVVTRRPTRNVLTVDELRAEKVGTVRGTALADAVSGAGVPADHVDDSFAPASLLEGLRAGKVSACVLGVERALPARQRDPELQVGMYIGSKVSLGFAMRKEDAVLRDALDDYIRNVRRTSSWNRLVLSYFGDTASDILKASR